MIDTDTLKATAPDLLTLAEPLTTLKKMASSNGGEWSGPCPFCGGKDRFSVQPYHTPEGRWLCRNCSDGKWQDVISFIERRDKVKFLDAVKILFGPNVQVAPEQAEQIRAERMRRQEEQRQEELALQEARRAELDASGAAQAYYRNMGETGRALWHERGLSDLWIDYFQVGYCPSRKFFRDEEPITCPTLTIPTWKPTLHPADEPSITWQCIGLVHRLLVDGIKGDKYRPHLADTGKPLFNCDLYAPYIMGDVLLVEGEIKAAVTWAHLQDIYPKPSQLRALTVIGVAGKGFKPECAPEFDKAKRIWICLDPDAEKAAVQVGKLLGPKRCRILRLPEKIDDMLIAGTLTVDDLPGLMATAKGIL